MKYYNVYKIEDNEKEYLGVSSQEELDNETYKVFEDKDYEYEFEVI